MDHDGAAYLCLSQLVFLGRNLVILLIVCSFIYSAAAVTSNSTTINLMNSLAILT